MQTAGFAMVATGKGGSQPLGMKARIGCAPHAFYSEVSDEIVLLNIDTGAYHSLDTVGAAIWRAIGTEATIEAVCTAMVADYPHDPERVRTETVEFITKLAERELVIVQDADVGV